MVERALEAMDERERFHRVLHLTGVPATPYGFLRAVCRVLGLPMRAHATDLFDQAHLHLTSRADDQAAHPILIIDDAEGLRPEILDLLRRLTAYALDAEDRFSVLLVGTEDLLLRLRSPLLEPLRTRIGYAQPLRPYNLEDTRNYVTFHLQRADVRTDLFTEEAVRKLFNASLGRPRAINQLALQILIQATVEGRDQLDGSYVGSQIAAHPLYDPSVAGD